MTQEIYDLIVIGGGPAGMMAAGQAAKLGLRVLLLEKMEKPLRKLRITGKGRCNLSNAQDWPEFSKHVFPSSRFLRPAFYGFSNTDLVDFFQQIGVATVVERGHRIFPVSGDAFDVAEALCRWIRKEGVEVVTHAEVCRLQPNGNVISSITVKRGGNIIQWQAKTFIIATGGLSYPATGSTGDGFRLAQETGHHIIPLHPSLSGIHIHNHPSVLKGVNLRNVNLELWIDGGKKEEEFGEITFNETGIEGPAVLRLSRMAIAAFEEKKKIGFRLNLKPAVPFRELQQRFNNDVLQLSDQSLDTLLRKYMPTALIQGFCTAGSFPQYRKLAEVNSASLDKLLQQLQSWSMLMSDYQGYERAVITAGGVSFSDVDSKTMCSRLFKNLFFAGEVLDLDADTGGYNLQIAFSTGCLAGRAIKNLLTSVENS